MLIPFSTQLLSRRRFLARNAMGIGSVALAWLLGEEHLLATPSNVPRGPQTFDLKPKVPHFPPQARSMISLFMHGGPSHIDLFDPKPELSKRSGEDYQGEIKFSFIDRATKKLFGSPWKFQKHGQSGTDVSELLPHFAGIVDDVCVVRSMHTDINGHEPSIWFMNTGRSQPGRPTVGSWLTYGLGSESQNLPAYVVLTDPGGLPVDGVRNWSNGWMPPLFQGTVVRPTEPRILNLDPPAHLKGALQEQNLAFLARLNRDHLARHPGESDLEARIASYELAARMQTSAKEALDISRESEATKKLYGLDDPVTREYGTRCLIARRLVERGVRFVQIFIHGQIWDNHESIQKNLLTCCRKTDQPSAALVKDLKARGLLDTTLVHWGGEIGRLPVTENHGATEKAGRDHNGQGFTAWLAGGGIKGGITYGETDEFGHKAVVNPVSPNDYHATLLHLFGLDYTKLAYHNNGQEQLLTDNKPCRVVKEILRSA
ncbi:MAG TPA: DUF1501 domain-containing protein [Candidatus Eisenbacteria bacterium]|nr:DUF1501 domain-containing protein [Candidatus Eisenbacteria bacterium]